MTNSITYIQILDPPVYTYRTNFYTNAFAMFINIFGSRSKTLDSVHDTGIVYPRKRSLCQKGVRFNTSRVVYYTHSKMDYDRGGMSYVDDRLPTIHAQADTVRPPVLDSDDEDSLNLDLTQTRKSRRNRSSFKFF